MTTPFSRPENPQNYENHVQNLQSLVKIQNNEIYSNGTGKSLHYFAFECQHERRLQQNYGGVVTTAAWNKGRNDAIESIYISFQNIPRN